MVEYHELDGGRKLDWQTIIWPIAVGFVLGFLLVKGVIYLPSVIVGQLLFQNWAFLKVNFAALASALLVQSITQLAGARDFAASRASGQKGVLSAAVGGVVAGLGMYMTGSCPGTAYAQMGAGVVSGAYIWCGGLVAVLLYGFFHRNVFGPLDSQARPNKDLLDDQLNCQYWHLGLPLGLGFVGACWLLENYGSRWVADVPSGFSTSDTWWPVVKDAAWNPYYVGALMGFLEVPLRLGIAKKSGFLYSYVSPVAIPLSFIGESVDVAVPQWFRDNRNPRGLWQAILAGCVALGAMTAAFVGDVECMQRGFAFGWSFGGGILLVLGYLIAGPALTGFGFSAFSDLNITALVGGVVFILSGMGWAKFFEALNVHPEDSEALLFSESLVSVVANVTNVGFLQQTGRLVEVAM